MYSLLGLWLIGATIALAYWIRRPQRTRYLVAYVLLMTAAFYTHYFTALCVLCHWLYLGLMSVGLYAIVSIAMLVTCAVAAWVGGMLYKEDGAPA